MSEAITNPTPKARFQESPDNVSKHRSLVDSPPMQRGIDFALLQYQTELTMQNKSMDQCAASALKMQGAQEFVQVFRNLAETIALPPSRSMPPANLNHGLS